jgi:GTPase
VEEKEDLEINEAELAKFTEVDETRAPVNIVFIGHVDVGKSTICGRN